MPQADPNWGNPAMWAFAFDVTLKATVLLGAVCGAQFAFRRASAARRHHLWVLTHRGRGDGCTYHVTDKTLYECSISTVTHTCTTRG